VQSQYVARPHSRLVRQMAYGHPNPQCAALSAAKERTGLSYSQIAQKVNTSEQRIIDICTGAAVPTDAEFQAITVTLGIQDRAPNDKAHKTA